MLRILLTYFFLFLIISISTNFSFADKNSPSSVSIGKYTAGCVLNSVELPTDGNGYQVIRPNRKRFYGHQNMIDFINDLTEDVKKNYSAKLLISDISKEDGGPILEDHSSHQIGLDVDILFIHKGNGNNKYIPHNKRENIKPVSLLKYNKTDVDENKWSWVNGEVLKMSAQDPRVDRIFVNPVIKKNVCTLYKDQPWLQKIRPWWGHEGHFHVRLNCPANSPKCVSIQKLPEGTGCESDLARWFKPEIYIERAKKLAKSAKSEKDIVLPEECTMRFSRKTKN